MTANSKHNEDFSAPEEQLHFSGRIWHELYPKVNPSLFLYSLRNEIDLGKYGSGIRQFYFTFVAERPSEFYEVVGTHFDLDSGRAEVAVQLPYDEVVSASPAQTIALMETAYLEGIDLLRGLVSTDDFDVQAFKEDVRAIFAKDKWYETAVPD